MCDTENENKITLMIQPDSDWFVVTKKKGMNDKSSGAVLVSPSKNSPRDVSDT